MQQPIELLKVKVNHLAVIAPMAVESTIPEGIVALNEKFSPWPGYITFGKAYNIWLNKVELLVLPPDDTIILCSRKDTWTWLI